MKWPEIRWGWGAAAILLLLPAALASQTTATPAPKKTEPIKWEVRRLKLNGVNAVDQKDLRLSIATDASHCVSILLSPICWISKSRFFYTRKYLDRVELARDLLRIRVYYFKRGYRETDADTLVKEISTDDVAVTFNITEGLPTLVSDITVNQTQKRLSDREIAKRVVLGKNSPLNLIRLDSSRVFLSQALWDKGYADAIVDTVVRVDTAARRATVEINLDPRWKATVSDILIEGNKKIDTRTILKSLTLRPGSLFKRSELLRSQRALYESNLFRRAAIEVPRQGDSSKVLIVRVQEAPLHENRLSLGFNTVDFFQFEGRLTQYNFLGRARQLDVQGAVGNLLANQLNGKFVFRDVSKATESADESKYFDPTYNLSLNLREPWFGAQANELGLSLFAHRRSSPGIYVDKGFGSSATFTREIVDRGPASINYRFEINRVEAGDVYFCINFGVCDQTTLGALRERQRLSPLTLTSSINRANDPFSPTTGYRTTFDFEHASAFTISDFRYNRASGDASIYNPVRKRGSLAGHLKIGWVRGLHSTATALGVNTTESQLLHPRKRFYSGGSRSVRGFGENQLGPRVLTIPASKLRANDPRCGAAVDITTCDPNAAGLGRGDFEPRPLGGNLVAEASAEFRFPIWQQLFGAVFVDGGYVSQKTAPALPKSARAVTPGFGVRYRSPVGPIRIDLGVNPGRAEELPVVTETTVNGEKKLVTLTKYRTFAQQGSGFRGALNRLTLHLSIGEAF
ncbi:MAG TPA: BamA/TamA family outer membrane protein [Gemmatimonadaceae bacterium]|nr:BamA/TamA family outer membrane protein [Gemmatimonadaceae bacterium]